MTALYDIDSWQNDECMEWPGSKNEDGYGRVRWGRSGYIAVHRLVWQATEGPIPEGMMVLHYCDNPPCYRRSHLRLGTHEDNMSDRVLAGHYRAVLGERNGQSKLTAEQVVEMRRLRVEEGWLQQRIADHFGITQPQVSTILRREAWKHV